MAQRPGFIVKNAPDVGSALDLAEPDAGDFNLLGNHRFGVISGCAVTVTGSSFNVAVAPGIVVVDGQLASTGGQVTLSTSSQDARFDLIVVNASGAVSAIQGNASPNPVFPDLPTDKTVVATIFVRPGVTPPQQSDVTDKRSMVQDRFITAINGTGLLLSSNDPNNVNQVKFSIRHDGLTIWSGDTSMERTAVRTLTVRDHLNVVGTVSAAAANFAGDLTVTGVVTSKNIKQGNGAPGATPGVAGDVYQDKVNGGLWTYTTTWVQLSAVPIPAGMIMASMSGVAAPGWLSLDGSKVAKTVVGALWDLFPQWQRDGGTNFQLPDTRTRFPMGSDSPGGEGGFASKIITVDNLPPHKHLTTPSTSGPAGEHTHKITINPDGAHGHTTDPAQGSHNHTISDPQHQHVGVEGAANSAFIHTDWNGRNKVDGYFNDASHTYSVTARPNTNPAATGVSVQAGGEHGHTSAPVAAHSHIATADPSIGAAHTHAIPEAMVGGGLPFPTVPPFFSVVWMIKT